MVATAATSAFFPAASPASDSGGKSTTKLVKLEGMKSKSAGSAGSLQVKANAQTPPKINGSSVGLTTPMESVKNECETSSHAPRTFINTLPDWSMLLAAITTIFLAAEKQWMMLDWKPRRSYEVGADRTASVETLMNHLQETALNHVKGAGLLGDGFGSTPEMCKKNLIWVVTRMQVVETALNHVKGARLLGDGFGSTPEMCEKNLIWVVTRMQVVVDRYPTWGDVVQVELGSVDLERMSRWSDLDINLHVNNVKYVGWILESAPLPILESHELSAMTLEYRRECGKDSVLQSLTAVSANGVGNLGNSADIECQHLLRLEDGAEIVRGRTVWRPKDANNFGNLGHQFPTEST
ncbi:Palmitoyl-acyl carrier protein thioesterase, chloroplastic [Morella rubra]|uniref:Acyl-[acyl-carrier-protein] hydrolase n=1 Tax=Morella rubra TaxID=262757 RepID=A0A6A1UK11_9ROSI|nr:Palmitoyl-acyl carrier protein thioesterase, chloroplastic [Morella rubra]